jgi:hypothetical protein
MPYIDISDRPSLDNHARTPATAGELNYAITRLVLGFIANQGGNSYANFNAAIGALECSKLELYRRMVAPYEDVKISQNGDVYPADGQPGAA